MNDRRRRPHASSATALLALIMLGTSGCGAPAHEPDAATSSPAETAVPAPAASTEAVQQTPLAPAPEAVTIDLQSVDRAAFDALVQRHQGKVVLVDFWATWCGPCLKQLPHTAELARQHEADGLVVVTVTVDEPEDLEKAKKRLADLAGDAPVIHLASSLGGGSAAMEAFEIGSGSAPQYKLYDRTGKLTQVFENDPSADRQYTTDDIDAAVAKLLAEKN